MDFGVNQGLVEELYLRYCSNPHSVDEVWRKFFDELPPEEAPHLTSAGHVVAPPPPPLPGAGKSGNGRRTNGNGIDAASLPATAEHFVVPGSDRAPRQSFPPSIEMLAATELQGRVSALVNAFRVRGHLFARLDPLGLSIMPPDELSLERFGLEDVDPETMFSTGDLAGPSVLPFREILRRLQETYCRCIGVEFTFLDDRDARKWLQERMEASCNRLDLSLEEQIRILTKLTDAEIFEQFLHTNFVGAKRFSGEGAESAIPLLDLLIEHSADLGVEEIAIGMAHRGRLNVLANIMDQNVREIFAEFQDDHPEVHVGRGDVKYHMGYSTDRTTASGKSIHVTLAFNPSHLEWVNPVVEGRVRAKQDRKADTARARVLPLLLHGDAAFVAQGIVAETLNLSELEGYRTGGTIHVVVNNQIGFTTSPSDARSCRYCTDITRMLRCPVFHVNGEDPEAVAQVALLATEYRQRFHKDVVIDLYCYRKYGHNEADEPRFTQPLMYEAVDRKRTVREVYVSRLVETGKLTADQAEVISTNRRAALEDALTETRKRRPVPQHRSMGGVWQPFKGGADRDVPDTATAVPGDSLLALSTQLQTLPKGFSPNKKLQKVLDHRHEAVTSNQPFDWGTGELLAFASLVSGGARIRLTGQDVRRGTFTHRHAVIFDTVTGGPWCPLASVAASAGRFEIFDSPLSEAGCLGFEYGYSLDSPDALVVWEAQFGDFANCAQVIIDQFISSCEDKWRRLSGLVLLLPHGFEGQGPEHSSARLERFLALCAEDNIQVCNLTTPAQYFHCLRRQHLRPLRKPLVIMSPKSLLRHPMARSTVADLSTGRFQCVIGDAVDKPSRVRRVLMCSGKIYYDLVQARQARESDDIAIVRAEQLYPIRESELHAALAPFPKSAELVWVQEEPWNMGAWRFIDARLPNMLGRPVRGITRPESGSPATGSLASHKLEQAHLMDESFAPP